MADIEEPTGRTDAPHDAPRPGAGDGVDRRGDRPASAALDATRAPSGASATAGSPSFAGLRSAVDAVFADMLTRWSGQPENEVSDTLLRDALATATGPGIGQLLEDQEPADLDELTLGEVVRAAERLASWAATVQADAIAEMQRRAGSRHEFVRDEVAALLSMSGQGAGVLTERASGLVEFPDLHDALHTGAVDTRRVDRALHAVGHLPHEEARTVLAEVLPRAEAMTPPQLRDAIRKVDAARNPEAVEKRVQAARTERCVRLEPAPDAMAWVRAFLPAADALAVFGAVDALAHHPAEEGDERTLANRRADALTEVLRHVLDSGAHPDGTPLSTPHGRRPHLSVIATPDVLRPGALGAATLEGYGPIPASVAREIAAEADWRAIGVDPSTGEAAGRSSCTYRPSSTLAARIVARDVTCTFPGCRRPAVRCDLDHITPFDPDRPAQLQTCEANLHTLCRRHHRLKTHGRWKVVRDAGTGVTTWTDPAGRIHTRDPVAIDPGSGFPRQTGEDGDEPVPHRPDRPTTRADAEPRRPPAGGTGGDPLQPRADDPPQPRGDDPPQRLGDDPPF